MSDLPDQHVIYGPGSFAFSEDHNGMLLMLLTAINLSFNMGASMTLKRGSSLCQRAMDTANIGLWFAKLLVPSKRDQ